MLRRNNEIISENVTIADNLIKRIIGLLGKKELKDGQVLYIPSCNTIHTFFMMMPIDIAMTDKMGTVVFTRENLKPWKFAGSFKAKDTYEFKQGLIRLKNIKIGDKMAVSEDNTVK